MVTSGNVGRRKEGVWSRKREEEEQEKEGGRNKRGIG